MGDIDRKVRDLVEKANTELARLGSGARFEIGDMITEDTGEKYLAVNVNIGKAPYMAYSSSNSVGIKTFMQGVYVCLTLATGGYRLKPMSEFARRMIPASIIPQLCSSSCEPAVTKKKRKTRMLAADSPRFYHHRTKYKG